MRLVIVYRDNTDYSREVTDFLREFSMRTGKTMQTKDPDTTEGDSFCQAYDVVQYPSILALSNDGSMLKQWQGTPLPQIDEVSYYAE